MSTDGSQRRGWLSRFGPIVVLSAYTVLACGPILLIVVNSFKSRVGIFNSPFALPTAETFSTIGYETVLQRSDFGLYFLNSGIVTVVSVLLTVVFGVMAAFALTEYRFRFSPLLMAYLAIGIMIPIRLGTVSLLRLLVSMQLVNSLTALVLVYVAMSLPLAVVLLAQFLRGVPAELKEAARVDGASEYRVLRIVLPTIRPGLSAVAVLSMLPVWNDLWFPLILAPGERVRTVTLGVQQFIGQFTTDWNAVLAALTLGALPLIALYLLFSKQFLAGLTEGIGK